MQKKYKTQAAPLEKVLASIKCKECKKPFTPKYKEQKFCSRPCYTAYLKANAPGTRLEKLFKPRNSKQNLTDPFDEVDDQLWAERAKYWEEQVSGPVPLAKRFGRGAIRKRSPLVLTGHGIRLSVERGALFVQNGYSYYPQKRQEWRLFPGDWRLPTKIVLVGASGSISLPVINWLNQQELPLIILDWQGEIVSVIGKPQTAADPEIVKAQREALESERGLEISIELIRERISASQETLKTFPKEYDCDQTVHKLELIKKSLKHRASNFTDLRMTEAVAAQIYFAVWRKMRLKWKESKRHPIPDDWHVFTQRESLIGQQNRHATHPVSAMLNYAYRVLESEVLIAAVVAGFDPTIGYLHTCRPGRMALIYDLMEPLRPKVDCSVLNFVRSQIFTPQDFLVTERGACRMNTSMVNRMLEKTTVFEVIQGMIQEVIKLVK